MTSMSEFIVHKLTDRHPEPTKRILCLTEKTILERDPQTYSVRKASCHYFYSILFLCKLNLKQKTFCY